MQILVTENLLENVSCVDSLCSKFHRSMCTSWSLLEYGYHYDRTCSPPAALSTLCSLHSGPNKVKQRHEYPRLSTSTRVLEKIPPKTREYPGFITLQISLVVVGREYRRGTRLKDMRWKIYFNIFFLCLRRAIEPLFRGGKGRCFEGDTAGWCFQKNGQFEIKKKWGGYRKTSLSHGTINPLHQ